MATTAKPEKVETTDNRVEIFVPRGSANEEPNFFISVNGVNYLLPRGKKAKVPPEVAYEFERSQLAQNHLDDTIDSLTEASKM